MICILTNCYCSKIVLLTSNFIRGQFWPPGIVVACVRPSVTKFVGMITFHTKFGPKLQNTFVKVPIDLGGQSNLTFKVKIYPSLSLSAP